jgi:hypothetical protein
VKVLIAFLFLSVILGGTSAGKPFLRRPILFVCVCGVVAASYYSYRVVR